MNIRNDNRYHKMALSWNIMTMMSFFIMYIFELKRENWSIKYLDIDNDKPDNALKEVIVKEKNLDKRMDLLNLYYYRIVNFTIFMNMANIGLVVKILYNDYHSQSTISCFVSFSLLILMKLYNSFIITKKCTILSKPLQSELILNKILSVTNMTIWNVLYGTCTEM